MPVTIEKCASGITGLDAISGGGLPRGRPTLVCGGPGCGKSLLAMEFVVRGARDMGEPGVFVSFEESIEELDHNVASLGFDLPALRERGLLAMDHVMISRAEIEESGEYDLEGLFVRLAHAIDSVGARRIALDTIETLFANLSDTPILRSELVRLFRWLKDRGLTAVVTGERGEGSLTRFGLEEYVSDCVLFLDHRVESHVSTRHLRFVKYRGAAHATNEYPFAISANGMRVLPVSALTLAHPVFDERVSTGLPDLDEMLSGGVYRGSSILLSGTAGTGKTTFGCHFVDAVCRAGEHALVVSFEESPAQIVRNMKSVGLDLSAWIDHGRLRIEGVRPQFLGLEQHILNLQHQVEEHRPTAVVLDPLNALLTIADPVDTHVAVLRLVDYLKSVGITAVFTTLSRDLNLEHTDVRISSLMDTWILLRDIELGGERNRGVYVLKSRGTRHSNQIREFTVGHDGIRMVDVYTGPEGVLTGSARLAQRAAEREQQVREQQEIDRLRRRLEHERAAFEAKQQQVRAEFERVRGDLELELERALTTEQRRSQDRRQLLERRGGGNNRKRP